MNDRHSLLDTVTNSFVPIHGDGYKFVFGAAVITLFLFVLAPPLGWISAFFTAAAPISSAIPNASRLTVTI